MSAGHDNGSETRPRADRREKAAGGSLQTLERGLDVLEILARSGPMSNADVAAELNLHRSIVYRVLRTLEARGFAQRDATGQYGLGLELAVLGQCVRQDLQTAALPELIQLADATGATAFVVVADGDEAVTLVSAPPRRIDGHIIVYHPTARHPLNRAASGLGVLAALPPRPGERAEVTAARRTGYVATHGELTPGVSGLAAPLALSDGTAACVSLVYISGHVDEPKAIDLMRQAAQRIVRATAHVT